MKLSSILADFLQKLDFNLLRCFLGAKDNALETTHLEICPYRRTPLYNFYDIQVCILNIFAIL